jgi:hypothetical protein
MVLILFFLLLPLLVVAVQVVVLHQHKMVYLVVLAVVLPKFLLTQPETAGQVHQIKDTLEATQQVMVAMQQQVVVERGLPQLM